MDEEIDREWAEDWAREWIECWNRHDHSAILEHYADDIEYRSPLVSGRFPELAGVIRSKSKLAEYIAIGLENNPDLRFALLDVFTGVREMTLLYNNARGGSTTESFQFDETRRVIRVSSCYSENKFC